MYLAGTGSENIQIVTAKTLFNDQTTARDCIHAQIKFSHFERKFTSGLTVERKPLSSILLVGSIVGTTQDMRLNPAGVVATNSAVVVEALTLQGNTIVSAAGVNLATLGSASTIVPGNAGLASFSLQNEGISSPSEIVIEPQGSGIVVLENLALVGQLRLDGNTVSNDGGGSNSNLVIRPDGTGKVSSAGVVVVEGIRLQPGILQASASDSNVVMTPSSGHAVQVGKKNAFDSDVIFCALNLSGDTVSTAAGLDIIVQADSTGRIMLGNELALDDLSLGGNTLSNTRAAGHVIVGQDGAGAVHVTSRLQVDDLTFDSHEVAGKTNVQVLPAVGGHVKVGHMARVDNIVLDGDTVSRTDTQTNGSITVQPAAQGSVKLTKPMVIDALTVANRTVASNSNSQEHIVFTPLGVDGKVVMRGPTRVTAVGLQGSVISSALTGADLRLLPAADRMLNATAVDTDSAEIGHLKLVTQHISTSASYGDFVLKPALTGSVAINGSGTFVDKLLLQGASLQ
jgi:hypothetical protein